MTHCDAFELRIEMKRRGALDAVELRALRDHLAGCPSCRNFEGFVDTSEEHLMSHSIETEACLLYTSPSPRDS